MANMNVKGRNEHCAASKLVSLVLAAFVLRNKDCSFGFILTPCPLLPKLMYLMMVIHEK